MTDPISDLLIRIRNAGAARKESVSIPYSNLKFAICTVLEKEGFVGQVSKKGKAPNGAKSIEVTVLYDGEAPKIIGTKRISKPSRRMYEKATNLRPVKNGYGKSIISTPKGILTGNTARKEKVGGEVLFQIW